MLKRTISAFVALPILFYVLLKGGIVLEIGGILLSLCGLYEFYGCFSKIDILPYKYIGYGTTLFFYFIFILNMDQNFYFLGFMLLLISTLIKFLYSKRKNSLFDGVVTIFGFIYIVVSVFHIPMISRIESDSNFFIWYPFILAFITDTSAYFSGYFFGKRKLMPEVSPKKTIEGSIGGVIGTLIFSVVFAYIFKREYVFVVIPLAFLGSILSQYGDLIASKIKRYVGIKDFGNIMPGHGGILDRVDSVLVTGPLVYYYIIIIQLLL